MTAKVSIRSSLRGNPKYRQRVTFQLLTRRGTSLASTNVRYDSQGNLDRYEIFQIWLYIGFKL